MSGCATVLLQGLLVWVRWALCSVWYKHGENAPVKYGVRLRRGQDGMALGMEISPNDLLGLGLMCW